jgi:hypothetical protein
MGYHPCLYIVDLEQDYRGSEQSRTQACAGMLTYKQACKHASTINRPKYACVCALPYRNHVQPRLELGVDCFGYRCIRADKFDIRDKRASG